MRDTFRWGILGCGRIAGAFAAGLAVLDDHEIVAVASRDMARAVDFSRASCSGEATSHRTPQPRAYDDYAALCSDPRVDAIYVATPHSHHARHARLVIDHGKALLCEKPFTVNARETVDVLEHAKRKSVFCMEAMWMRFRPAVHRLLELTRAGRIGRPEMLHASFGFRGDFDPSKRHFDRGLAGGALLDVGVYCVTLALLVFGNEVRARASLAALGDTGVDERSGYLLRFDDGAIAILSSAIGTDTSHDARIDGSQGSIVIPDFWKPERLVISGANGSAEERFEEPGNGYQWQAIEVARCVRDGLLESPLRPHADTRRVMEELDALRAPWGLCYPADEAAAR